MGEQSVFVTVCALLLVVLVLSVVLTLRGSQGAKYFLWTWALLLLLGIPFMSAGLTISGQAAAVMMAFFAYSLALAKVHRNVQLEVSHEETRRVLAESNRRIDEERRTISRRLHDDINPNLLLCKSELRRLESVVSKDSDAARTLASIHELIGDSYTKLREIIKNTRIEVIDSIGFTAAIESLISHYTNFFDKPTISLEHDLPKRPRIDEEIAISTYKIIREAIYNAIKHSNARQVSVRLKMDTRRNRLQVDVSDDGAGIRPRGGNGEEMAAGIGLIDMRERAHAIGANLSIQPAFPSNAKRPGTRVSFSVSLLSS
ncbi:MAG: histidine kinase [Rhodocyclaceae bacterium]|nr:histidine kinase [Rhodocyclaceae bacterium]